MKPISELVRTLQSIDAVDFASSKSVTDKHYYHLSGVIQHADFETEHTLECLKNSYNKVVDEYTQVQSVVQDYKKTIQQEIKKQSTAYYIKSEEMYYESRQDSVDYQLERIRNNNFLNGEEIKELFVSRITSYNRWKYPAIQIRPAFGEYTDLIKGCDPLYLLDTEDAFFEHTKKKWTPTYQRRLRYYTFNETNEQLFHMLPENQFGFVLSVDYLDYKPLNILGRYLVDIFLRLRPGGTFMFTYNNCDRVYGARNVENNFKCYTPGNEVVNLAQQAGYTVSKHFDEFEHVSWLELTKPGDLVSLRGGQTLGEILSL